jgi:hypothetical protein
MERMTGIEPAPSVWKTEALPLSYIRRAELNNSTLDFSRLKSSKISSGSGV